MTSHPLFGQDAVAADPENASRSSDARAQLLQEILRELDTAGVTYALLHAGGEIDAAVQSDVDIAFDRDPNTILLPIFERLSLERDVRLIHCLHYDCPHGYYYVLRASPEKGSFLHLDCLYDPIGVNRYLLPTSYLLTGATAAPWGRRTEEGRKAVYLLLKRAIKGGATGEQLDVLRASLRHAGESEWSAITDLFGAGARALVEALLEPRSSERVDVLLAMLRRRAGSEYRRRHPLLYARSHGMNFIRQLRRFVRPTGLFVVILGPDGSGKSTVAALLVSQLERAFRRTWRFHWRPTLLPKLARRPTMGWRVAADNHVPAEVSKYRGPVSLARFLYYWMDFVLGYWLVIYPRKAQTTLVLGERYFPDVLVHPQRYGFSVPHWFMRLAARCVPSPDLLVLLKDDPKVIYARKPELPPARIASQMQAYENEARHWGGACVIDTQSGASAVASRIADLILAERHRRTRRQLAPCDRDVKWRGFPSARRAKVWFSDGDTLPNALKLYHPYSKSGRSVKFLMMHCVPTWLHHALFRRHADAHTLARLGFLTQLIHHQLGNDGLVVSFYTGTAGPHQKLTAQATRGGTVISYVKIAESEPVARLLRAEAEILDWLRSREFGAASIPHVLALAEHRDHRLLFVASPSKPAVQRPLEPDDDDARFLSALALLDLDTRPVSEAFDHAKLDAHLQRLQTSRPDVVAMLHTAIRTVEHVLGERGVVVTPCHGDYAPWNSLRLDDGTLYVFDWEYAKRSAPALSDLFHRILVPARLVLRQAPSTIMKRLLALADHPLLGRVVADCGIPRQELPAYVLIFLLDRLASRATETLDQFLTESVAYLLRCIPRASSRPVLLISAYACEPGHGSEPGVGWHMAQAICREHDAWVITRSNNRQRIEAALARQPNPHLHFWYVDLPSWIGFWKKGQRGIRLYYYLWQFAAWRRALKLMRTVQFDGAHHVTFVNDFTFTFLALLPIPFAWGPVGSVSKRPALLSDGTLSLMKERVVYYAKVLLRSLDPLFWLSASRSGLVIGINDEIRHRFPISLLAADKFVAHTAIGVERDVLNQCASPVEATQGLRVLSMGRLIPLKAFHLTLQAFAVLARNHASATLTIVGDGPLRESLEERAVELEVRDKVVFVQRLPRAEALTLMTRADVFLFPSFEAAGMVVLEAMAHGLPIVCLENTGPAEMVTPDCGFAVEVGGMSDTVDRLARALDTLARDAALRLNMGAAAKRRIQHRYLWEDRHESIRDWYRAAGIESNVLARSSQP